MESDPRPPKEINDPDIEKINNHSVPVMTEGKVAGGNALTVQQQFAFLM